MGLRDRIKGLFGVKNEAQLNRRERQEKKRTEKEDAKAVMAEAKADKKRTGPSKDEIREARRSRKKLLKMINRHGLDGGPVQLASGLIVSPFEARLRVQFALLNISRIGASNTRLEIAKAAGIKVWRKIQPVPDVNVMLGLS